MTTSIVAREPLDRILRRRIDPRDRVHGTKSDVIASILGNMAAGIECEHDGNVPVTPAQVLKKIDAVEKQTHYE